MAALGGIEAELGGLPTDLKKALSAVFRYLVPNLRHGPVGHQDKSENFQAYYLTSTTAGSTGEFSIAHGLGRTPYLAIPVLALDSVGAEIVPLEVSRAADNQRVYLKSSNTNRVFTILVE